MGQQSVANTLAPLESSNLGMVVPSMSASENLEYFKRTRVSVSVASSRLRFGAQWQAKFKHRAPAISLRNQPGRTSSFLHAFANNRQT
jgi:hypothetical protein